MTRGITGFEVLVVSENSGKHKKWYKPCVEDGSEDHVTGGRRWCTSVGRSSEVVDGVDCV